MLKNLKNKMYEYIDKYGLTSTKSLFISQEIDLEINKYYNNTSIMKYHYDKSILGLKKYFHLYNVIPSPSKWNTYAFEHNFLSSVSIEYISCNSFNSWCKNCIK